MGRIEGEPCRARCRGAGQRAGRPGQTAVCADVLPQLAVSAQPCGVRARRGRVADDCVGVAGPCADPGRVAQPVDGAHHVGQAFRGRGVPLWRRRERDDETPLGGADVDGLARDAALHDGDAGDGQGRGRVARRVPAGRCAAPNPEDAGQGHDQGQDDHGHEGAHDEAPARRSLPTGALRRRGVGVAAVLVQPQAEVQRRRLPWIAAGVEVAQLRLRVGGSDSCGVARIQALAERSQGLGGVPAGFGPAHAAGGRRRSRPEATDQVELDAGTQSGDGGLERAERNSAGARVRRANRRLDIGFQPTAEGVVQVARRPGPCGHPDRHDGVVDHRPGLDRIVERHDGQSVRICQVPGEIAREIARFRRSPGGAFRWFSRPSGHVESFSSVLDAVQLARLQRRVGNTKVVTTLYRRHGAGALDPAVPRRLNRAAAVDRAAAGRSSRPRPLPPMPPGRGDRMRSGRRPGRSGQPPPGPPRRGG